MTLRFPICTIILFTVLKLEPALARVAPEQIKIEQIGATGLTLDRGWRFQPSDRPEFKRPDYDDRGWNQILTTKLVTRLPELQGLHIGWLRLHFIVSDSLQRQTLFLTAEQSCASELYLDGRLIKTSGRISGDASKLIVAGVNEPPLALDLGPGAHVLAVRFAVAPEAYHLRSVNVLMNITLHHILTYDAMLRGIFTNAYLYVFLTAIFFLLGLLHLAFFRYDRSIYANLYFSVYALSNAVSFSIVSALPLVKSMPLMLVLYAVSFGLILLSSVWLIQALQSLYGFNARRLRLAIWVFLAVALVALLFDSLIRVFGFTLLIFEAIQIWMTIRALRKRCRGAGIIGTSFAISVVFLITGIAIGVFNLNVAETVWNLIWVAVFLSPPFGISLYLSRESALDSRSLREKLAEVEKLSALTIAQEQEKQQLLAAQNEMLEVLVDQRTAELNTSLTDLRAAQAQLIQSEKMASLGELTAGIAHEIQNPLNFVNNFSDVSVELLDELKAEIATGNLPEVALLADDIRQNLEKIAHHGKRADGIVKGMLQHSRSSSGVKEPVDLNNLVTEYLRLSYHGLREKDRSFQAELVTVLDPALPKINAVPQEIGRVLLNIFNNAFQAVASRNKTADPTYEPKVIVETEESGRYVSIRVKDNGEGVPEQIRDKIFQPFFTTKPTGEGTGLGLSLSYDIVVKGHGGKLQLNQGGSETVFELLLPR